MTSLLSSAVVAASAVIVALFCAGAACAQLILS